MREGKINKWVYELVNLYRHTRSNMTRFPNGFYKELTEEEQAEVVKRFRDRIRNKKPFGETK
jgi:hypothetical protein